MTFPSHKGSEKARISNIERGYLPPDCTLETEEAASIAIEELKIQLMISSVQLIFIDMLASCQAQAHP